MRARWLLPLDENVRGEFVMKVVRLNLALAPFAL
jgi:hypothetical protein